MNREDMREARNGRNGTPRRTVDEHGIALPLTAS